MTAAPADVHLNAGRALSATDLSFTSYRAMLDARREDSRLFLSYYDRAKKTHEISFRDFHLTTSAWVSFLTTAKPEVRAGSRAIVLLGNSIDAFYAYSALLYIGAAVVPIDPQESEAYVKKIADFSGADAAIVSREWAARLHGIPLIACEEIVASRSLPVLQPSADPLNEVASVFFTSGTTGDSKGVVQTMGSTLANIEGTLRAAQLTKDDVLMSCLPLFHVNAFNFSFLLPLYTGCRIVYQNGFFPNLWSVVLDEGVTVASLSPPVLRLLLKDSRPIERSKTLRYVISASSALHRDDLSGFLERFQVRVNQAYGLSETINFTLFTPPDLSETQFGEAMSEGPLPPAGIAVWGGDVQLLNTEGEIVREPGLPGEVCVRGWSVLKEYLGNRTATESAFAGGYFHTGDVAYFREFSGKRFYYLCGRIKETVKRQGKQIYLSEIDQAAREIGLENACGVGFKNRYTDEEIGLFLVRGENERRGHEEILAALAEKLQYAKCPKAIVEGEKIPRTSVGKIRRTELEKEFAKYAETRFQAR